MRVDRVYFVCCADRWMNCARSYDTAGQTTTNAIESYHKYLKHGYLDCRQR